MAHGAVKHLEIEPRRVMAGGVHWHPDKGYGFAPPIADGPVVSYDAEYFNKYVLYAGTKMARELNRARCDMVERHWSGEVLDVGIGCGSFIEAMEEREHSCMGFDVNPVGVGWLRQRRLYQDLYDGVEAATFWDALEHMLDPKPALAAIQHWAFISIPIYRDLNECLGSKHLRPNEHFWHFTRDGLCLYMREAGFEVREENWMESEVGRDSIGSFAFERV